MSRIYNIEMAEFFDHKLKNERCTKCKATLYSSNINNPCLNEHEARYKYVAPSFGMSEVHYRGKVHYFKLLT